MTYPPNTPPPKPANSAPSLRFGPVLQGRRAELGLSNNGTASGGAAGRSIKTRRSRRPARPS